MLDKLETHKKAIVAKKPTVADIAKSINLSTHSNLKRD